MILLADLHLGIRQDNQLWLDVSLNLAKEIRDFAVKYHHNTIAILGDIFENTKSLNQKTLNVVCEIVGNIWREFKVILVRGNHDTYYKTQSQPNWLNIFKEYSNVIRVDEEPYYENNFCFVPWGYDISDITCDYLFGHFEVNKFRMNNKFDCINSQYNLNDFKEFKHVYSGHFHFPQTIDNFTYLGSPFHNNFGDVGSERGYYSWKNGDIKFVRFTSAPQYVIIRTDGEIKNVTGNIVKLVFDKDYGVNKNNDIIESVSMLTPITLFVDTSKFNIDENLTNVDELHLRTSYDVLLDYVDKAKLPEHLNKKTLYRIIDGIMREISVKNIHR